MLAAASGANPIVSVPLAFLMGGALYLLIKAEPRMPKLPVVVAVLFGASASATILALFNGAVAVFSKK